MIEDDVPAFQAKVSTEMKKPDTPFLWQLITEAPHGSVTWESKPGAKPMITELAIPLKIIRYGPEIDDCFAVPGDIPDEIIQAFIDCRNFVVTSGYGG